MQFERRHFVFALLFEVLALGLALHWIAALLL